MSKELATVDTYSTASLTEKQAYVLALSRAGDLLPKSLLGTPVKGEDGRMVRYADPGKVLLMAETGAMLGLHPMAALQGIHIIDGKPSLSANLLAALVHKAGHKLRVKTTGEGKDLVAIATLIRSDDPDYPFEVTWTMTDAQRAGLLNKDNWKKYPRAMLKSRAITEVIREGASDVTLVPAYTPEELGIEHTDESGEPIELTHVRETPKEAPIPQTSKIIDEEWWAEKIEALGDGDEALALYRQAKTKGVLAQPIHIGDEVKELGRVIIEVGEAFRAAEKSEEPQPEDDDEPAVLEAEIMNEGE